MIGKIIDDGFKSLLGQFIVLIHYSLLELKILFDYLSIHLLIFIYIDTKYISIAVTSIGVYLPACLGRIWRAFHFSFLGQNHCLL